MGSADPIVHCVYGMYYVCRLSSSQMTLCLQDTSADSVAFAIILNPGQARHKVGPDLDPNWLSLW